MKHIHNKLQAVISKFLPDMQHLPTSTAAKNALFFLGIFGLATMFYAQADASVNIDTSLSNNVMTIQQLIVKDGTAWKIDLSNLGIKLNLGSPLGVLKRDNSGYIKQGLIQGPDIDVNTIDGTKILSGAINNSHIANNAITNIKIATGSITCDKLNIPGFSCSSSGANGSCANGTYLQGITTGGVRVCASGGGGGGGTGGLPVCDQGETLIFTGGVRTCHLGDSSAGNGGSLWIDGDTYGSITNLNSGGNVGVGLTNPSTTLNVSGSFLVNGAGNLGECTDDGQCAAGQSCLFGTGGGVCVVNAGEGDQCAGFLGTQCNAGLVCMPENPSYRDPQQSDQGGTCQTPGGGGGGGTFTGPLEYDLQGWLPQKCSCDSDPSTFDCDNSLAEISYCIDVGESNRGEPQFKYHGNGPTSNTMAFRQCQTSDFDIDRSPAYDGVPYNGTTSSDLGPMCYVMVSDALGGVRGGNSWTPDATDGSYLVYVRTGSVASFGGGGGGGGAGGGNPTVAGLATPDASSILYVGNGKVGILTKTPEYALDVVGAIRAAQVLTLSDARLKTNIVPIADALDKLMKMNGYMYTLKLDGSTQYGVLAQEVETLFPYLVSTDTNGYKAVNYNGLIAPIIESIHTLNTKINNTEKIYESNEARIQALEAKLNK